MPRLNTHRTLLDVPLCCLQHIRRQCFIIYQRRNNPSLVEFLGPNAKPNEVILFLKRTLAYDLN